MATKVSYLLTFLRILQATAISTNSVIPREMYHMFAPMIYEPDRAKTPYVRAKKIPYKIILTNVMTKKEFGRRMLTISE